MLTTDLIHILKRTLIISQYEINKNIQFLTHVNTMIMSSRILIERMVNFRVENFSKEGLLAMQQKKTKKRVKMKKSTAATRTTRQGVLSLAEKVEKEFRQIPTKLAKLYQQELMTLKRQETKLKAELNKTLNTQKTAQKKQAALATANSTATNKKQLAGLKKTLTQTNQSIKTLNRDIEKIAKDSAPLQDKQLKYTTLSKELAKLEKELLAKIKATKATKTQKKAAKKIKNSNPKPMQPSFVADEVTEETAVTIPVTETVEVE